MGRFVTGNLSCTWFHMMLHFGVRWTSREKSSLIALCNCSIQRSKCKFDLKVIANDDKEVALLPKKYKIDKPSLLGSKPSVKLCSINEVYKLAKSAITSIMAKVTSSHLKNS